MDPVSAINLAGTALEFLEFGVKIVSLAQEINSSKEGTTLANAQLEESAGELDRFCVELAKHKNVKLAGLDADDRAIVALCSKCAAQARDIRTLLFRLRAPKDANFCIHLLQAVKTHWKDTDLREMERLLEKSTRDLQLHLTAAVYKQQRSLRDDVQRTHRQARSTEPLQIPQTSLRSRQDLLDRSVAVEEALASRQQAVASATYGTFVERLNYAGMRKRYDAIQVAHSRTFEWVFSEEHEGRSLGFQQWLKTNSGMFWITGKAGSGKSTLMKYICSNPRTEEDLAIWSGSQPTIMAKYFFWIGGSTFERSQAGLVQTLLFEILSQEEALLAEYSKSHPMRFREILHGSPTTQQLEHLLGVIKTSNAMKHRFCFFIDGLDEFEGRPREICDFLINLASTVNVKLCVSSRPWNEFENAFGSDFSKVLRVHDHTRGDIQLYIQDLIVRDSAFQQLQDLDERYSAVVAKISESAQGVFLWVFLVVRELRSNLPDLQSIEDFEHAVDAFPPDLDSYFGRMIASIPENGKEKAAKLLLMLLNALSRVKLIQLIPLFIDKIDIDTQRINDVPVTELQALVKVTRTRINAHCKDLVDIHQLEDVGDICECNMLHSEGVDFLHRTVIDFLDEPSIRTTLNEQAGKHFDPHLAFGICALFDLQSLPWNCPHRQRLSDDEAHGAMDFPGAGWILSHLVGELFESLLLHAHLADDSSRRNFISLFDRVDQRMAEVYTRKALFEATEFQADTLLSSTMMNMFDYQMTFSGMIESQDAKDLAACVIGGAYGLARCVQFGMTWFVLDKLSRKQNDTTNGEVPAIVLKHLLYTACCKGIIVTETAQGKTNMEAGSATFSAPWAIHLPNFKLLTEAGGCQPNDVLISGRTQFHGFLTTAINRVRKRTSGELAITVQASRAVADTFRIFLAHGAEFPTDPDVDPKLADVEGVIRELCTLKDADELIQLTHERLKAQRGERKSKREAFARVRKSLHLRL